MWHFVPFKRKFKFFKYLINLEFQCGGALVSRKFIVTAGHCISRAKLRDIVVYLGELDTQDSGFVFEPFPAEKHTVIQKFIHPKFRFRLTQPDRFDVAVMKLKKPAGYKWVYLLTRELCTRLLVILKGISTNVFFLRIKSGNSWAHMTFFYEALT